MITNKETLNELYGYVLDFVESEDIIRKLYSNDISSFNIIIKNVKALGIFSSIPEQVLEKNVSVIIWHIIQKKLPNYEYKYLLGIYAKEVLKN